MQAEPQTEHAWLQSLVGEWTYEIESVMVPGEASGTMKGRETVRSLGGLWIVAEGESEMPDGGVASSRMTLGYDPAAQHFVGSWVGSMMTHQWIYRGRRDAAGKVLTLDTEGPSFAGDGTTTRYQDVITVESPDHRILTSRVMDADGSWRQFMTGHYRRRA